MKSCFNLKIIGTFPLDPAMYGEVLEIYSDKNGQLFKGRSIFDRSPRPKVREQELQALCPYARYTFFDGVCCAAAGFEYLMPSDFLPSDLLATSVAPAGTALVQTRKIACHKSDKFECCYYYLQERGKQFGGKQDEE